LAANQAPLCRQSVRPTPKYGKLSIVLTWWNFTFHFTRAFLLFVYLFRQRELLLLFCVALWLWVYHLRPAARVVPIFGTSH
jgi:hypothetical protein